MTSNAPSAARLRHAEAIEAPRVDAASFRQGWRVRTRLDGLLASGRIAGDEWQAAVEYRDAYARIWAGRGGDLAGVRTSGGADLHDRQIALVGTQALLDAVERHIGPCATGFCVACIVLDLSWSEIGRRCGRSYHTAEAWTADAIRALACAWATRQELRSDGFKVPPEARRRVRAS